MCCGQSEGSEAFQTLAFHEANTFRYFRSQQSSIRQRLRWKSEKARISDTCLRIKGFLHGDGLTSQAKVHPKFIPECKRTLKVSSDARPRRVEQ